MATWEEAKQTVGCQCVMSDSWRCAKERQLRSIGCGCHCHRYIAFEFDVITEHFNDDEIRRGDDIPKDVFSLIHDLAYHNDARDVWMYVHRAREILRRESGVLEKSN